MCGRFFIDEDMMEEIRKIARDTQAKLNFQGRREVFPTNTAPVIYGQNEKFGVIEPVWGYPRWDNKKGVLINARAETVTERRTFKESVQKRRCIIPVSGFYEWDANKQKIAFMDRSEPVLFLAGFFKQFQDVIRFIIITTAGNNSIADVHDRMPLTLDRSEMENWIFDPTAYLHILNKVPEPLKRETE